MPRGNVVVAVPWGYRVERAGAAEDHPSGGSESRGQRPASAHCTGVGHGGSEDTILNYGRELPMVSSEPRNPGDRVEDDLAVPLMDHLAPDAGDDVGSRKRVEGVLIDVVAPYPVRPGKRLKSLDRVEGVGEVRAFGDAVSVAHGVAEDRGRRRGRPGPLQRLTGAPVTTFLASLALRSPQRVSLRA